MTVSEPYVGRLSSAGRMIALGLFVLMFTAWLWSISSWDYVPTPFGDFVAAIGALTISGLVGLASVFDPRFAADAPKQRQLEAESSPMAFKPVRVALVAGFMFLLAFGGIEGGFLRLWNAAVGADGDLTMTVSGYTDGGPRSGCAGLKVREAPWLWRAAVCASYRYHQEPPPGSLLDLHGWRSPVGIKVTRFTVRPGPSAESS